MAAEAAAQKARFALWTPVAMGLGAAGYFGLKSEPPLWLFLSLTLAAIGAVTALRGRRGLALPLALVALALAGALAAKARTLAVAAPVVSGEQRVRLVEGWVVDIASPGAGGQRLLIAPVRIEDLGPGETPVRVRVSLRPDAAAPPPGSPIRLRALLGPPPGPASPGAYDFARDAWFDRVGGVGLAMGPPRPALIFDRPPFRLRLAMAINAMRWRLAERIVARVGPRAGGVAAAMVTGHEAWIAPEQVEAMRASGLAHILSISGLHMAIVGGFVFAGMRLGVAAWPWLALRAPGKKVAALAALAAVALYLVVSGAPPPAERAAVTAAVAFGAILADRQAISLRSLAVAALVILLLQPEAVVTPGFQMSFAATAALVALAEAWPRTVREINAPWWIRWPQAAGVWIVAAVGASFVAGMATGPFAMHHFNRVASYGLIANLLVAPLSSFVIMPFLALGAALEPFGLGGPFLTVAGWGIEAMLAVGATTAGQPGATVTVASAPDGVLAAAFLGILVLCLWKGRGRWLGLPLALSVALWPKPAPPHVWLASDGAAAAVRMDRAAVLLRPDSRRFAADLWSRRRGLVIAEDAETVRDELFDCDRFGCAPRAGAPDVALWAGRKAPKSERLSALCAPGRLVILRSADPGGGGCVGAFVLTADDFARGGSAELWRTPNGWRIAWANDRRGARPWVR